MCCSTCFNCENCQDSMRYQCPLWRLRKYMTSNRRCYIGRLTESVSGTTTVKANFIIKGLIGQRKRAAYLALCLQPPLYNRLVLCLQLPLWPRAASEGGTNTYLQVPLTKGKSLSPLWHHQDFSLQGRTETMSAAGKIYRRDCSTFKSQELFTSFWGSFQRFLQQQWLSALIIWHPGAFSAVRSSASRQRSEESNGRCWGFFFFFPADGWGYSRPATTSSASVFNV